MRARSLWLVVCPCVVLLAAAAHPQGEAAPAAPAVGPPAAPAAEDAASEKGPVITATAEGVSVYAVRCDAHALLTELARQTGFSIIVDDSVRGVLTVNFQNRKVSDIIRDIAATYGLACRENDGVFTITEGLPAHVSSYLLSEMASVRPDYIPVSDAEQLLPVFLQDYTAPSFHQNAVVLSAPPEILEKFRGDVKQFDVPAAQIMIEVLMVEFGETNTDEFYAKLGWSRNDREATTDSAHGSATFHVLGDLPVGFTAELRAMEAAGKAHVRANPRIATVSGREASIFIGERRFLAKPVEMSGGDDEDDDNGRQINFINAGVNLSITPWTGGEGEIQAQIQTEVSTMSAPDAVTGLPQKQTRSASTDLRMLDGETVLIGGLVQDEMIQTKSKIPILGDIPLIGKLFRHKNTRRFQTELVVFVTANILQGSNGHAEPKAAEEANATTP